MPFRTLFISALAVVFLATPGCKKNSNNNNSSNSADISVAIGGATFKPTITNAIYGVLSKSYVLAGFSVNNGDSTIITLELNTPFPLSTDLGATGKAFIVYQDSAKKYSAGASYGPLSFIVTSLDSVNHKIAGTFSGNLYALSNRDTLSMKNGTFDATYSVVNNF